MNYPKPQHQYNYHAAPRQQPAPAPRRQPEIAHHFENPAYQYPGEQQQQQQQPPQGYPPAGTPQGAPQAPPSGGAYGYGHYPQEQQQQQQQYGSYGGNYPGGSDSSNAQAAAYPPYPQQQQHQQQQGGVAGYDQQYAPQQHQQPQQYENVQQRRVSPPQQQQQYHNPDTIEYVAVNVGTTVSRPGEFNFSDPSVPRLMQSELAEDLAWRLPAPDYMVPVSHLSVRPTMRVFPSSSKVAESIGLPLGITVNPFADSTVPQVDYTEIGNRVIRCRKCNAYINPFTSFTDGGRKWQCILCRSLNETLAQYGCALDRNGLRQDLASRPELLHASVDVLATPEYLRTPPRRPIFLLMLDCSYAAVSSGLLGRMCEGALQALEEMQDDELVHMGVIGYDATVYFFNLRPTLRAPCMVTAPDTVNDISSVNDAFRLDPVELPCPIKDLVVPVKGSYHLLRALLEQLPTMFAQTKEVGCAFGPALTGAISMLENNGGKIICSICSIPSHGQGDLKKRFDVDKMSNQPKEYTMLSAASDWYKQRALACTTGGISVDIIAGMQSESIDLATIAPLARFSSGNIYVANELTMPSMGAHVRRILSRFTAFDAVMRVRSSPGLVIPNFYGHCYVREPELLSLPVGTQDSSFTAEFSLSPNFKGSYTYIQFAVMYTSRSRERRIRVHTLQVPVSALYGQVINSINSIGMASFLMKMTVDAAVNRPFVQAQEATTNRLVTALKRVQQHLVKQGARGQPGHLLIPASMRFIPQILSGFFRNYATGAATSRAILPDRRVAAMASVMSAPPEALLPSFLCWTYQVYAPTTAIDASPVAMYPTEVSMSSRSVVLCVLQEAVVMWYGRRSSPAVLEYFQLPPADAPPGGADQLGEQQEFSSEQANDLVSRTYALVQQLEGTVAPAFAASLVPCLQGKGAFEPAMSRSMLDDTHKVLLSYQQYMANLMTAVNKAP